MEELVLECLVVSVWYAVNYMRPLYLIHAVDG